MDDDEKSHSTIHTHSTAAANTWECLNCSTFNERFAQKCAGCEMNRDEATNMDVNLLYSCQDCNHRHRQGVFCHVFVQIPDNLDDDDIENGDLDLEDNSVDDDDDEDNDDDDALGENDNKKKKEKFSSGPTKIDPNAPLPTPKEYKKAGFVRCNCTEGMPEGSVRYMPCPKRQYAGNDESLEIATWFKLQDAPPPTNMKKTISTEDEEKMSKKKLDELHDKIRFILPLVHRFSHLGKECPNTAKCNHAWHDGTIAYAPYRELRDCTPYFSFRPHNKAVDALNLVIMATGQRVVFSGGDRRILASDIDTGEVITTIARDSGEVPLIYERDEKLISVSSNGSIKIFSINHVLSRTKLEKTTWEHSRCIRGLLMSDPTGTGVYCKAHGIENHICEFYTVSEDRRLIVWDRQSSEPIRVIESKSIRHHSYISLAQSDRHLLVGTTDASIFVFTKHNYCERDDVHGCSTPNSKKIGCLQIALKLPPKIITVSNLPPEVNAMNICKTNPNYIYPNYDYNYQPIGGPNDPNYINMRLYAGDNTGQLTIWCVPEFFGIDYRPILTKKLHQLPINVITNTDNYILTLGDDGIIFFITLQSLTTMRKLDVLKWAIYNNVTTSPLVPRKLKSIEIEDDEENGGTMVIGTSYGDIFCLYTGFTI